MITPTRHINLRFPRSWNQCTTKELELIADVTRDRIEHADRYHPFSMEQVKLALFFALADIRILEGPNPRVPVEEQYYLVRQGKEKEPFSLYLYQIQYWIYGETEIQVQGTSVGKSGKPKKKRVGILDWLDADSPYGLTIFPYERLKLRRSYSFSAFGHQFVFKGLLRESFRGPHSVLNGASWQQYRWAQDTLSLYTQQQNRLLQMKASKSVSDYDMKKQTQAVDMAKSMFLSTLFCRHTAYVDTDTHIRKRGFKYHSNQATDNAQYFRNFPDTQFQVILFWWTGVLHYLSKKYPHVFKTQKLKKGERPSNPMEIYTATTATMEKYVGLNAQEVDNEPYNVVLEHLERMAKESEEIEKIRKKR